MKRRISVTSYMKNLQDILLNKMSQSHTHTIQMVHHPTYRKVCKATKLMEIEKKVEAARA